MNEAKLKAGLRKQRLPCISSGSALKREIQHLEETVAFLNQRGEDLMKDYCLVINERNDLQRQLANARITIQGLVMEMSRFLEKKG